MKMKKKWIVATSIAIFLVLGSLVTALILSSAKATGTNGNAANDSTGSGALVIAWNKELLHIVQTPGAQPATVHPTRSYALLHAAICASFVPITGAAPAYLSSLPAPGGAGADAAAAQAGHD